jgi:AcrR family transcriptional regulator
MGHPGENAREVILDAAEDLVLEVGAGHLTLDLVAKRSGVSKGGFLYHFPNKEALLRAMLDRRVIRIEENRRRKRACSGGQPVSAVAAYILSSLEEDPKSQKLSVALLAASAHNPQLLLPYRGEFKKLLEEFVEEGLDFRWAAIVVLAVNGLKIMDLLSLAPFGSEELSDIIEGIITLSKTKPSA